MRAIAGFLVYLALVAVIAAGAHAATIAAYPGLAMARAMNALSSGGEGLNQWRHGARVGPESRSVVRPSPDLAYSSCVYDLWQGPVTITVVPSEGMWSLSLYDDASNVFGVYTDQSSPEGVRLTLIRTGAAPPTDETGLVLESPSRRGIALTRRLAASAEAFAAADMARKGDACGL